MFMYSIFSYSVFPTIVIDFLTPSCYSISRIPPLIEWDIVSSTSHKSLIILMETSDGDDLIIKKIRRRRERFKSRVASFPGIEKPPLDEPDYVYLGDGPTEGGCGSMSRLACCDETTQTSKSMQVSDTLCIESLWISKIDWPSRSSPRLKLEIMNHVEIQPGMYIAQQHVGSSEQASDLSSAFNKKLHDTLPLLVRTLGIPIG